MNEAALLNDLSDACHRFINDEKNAHYPELVEEMRETCRLVEERLAELGLPLRQP